MQQTETRHPTAMDLLEQWERRYGWSGEAVFINWEEAVDVDQIARSLYQLWIDWRDDVRPAIARELLTLGQIERKVAKHYENTGTVPGEMAAAEEVLHAAMTRLRPLVRKIAHRMEGKELRTAASRLVEAAELERDELVKMEDRGALDGHLFLGEAQLGAIAALAEWMARDGWSGDTASDIENLCQVLRPAGL